MLRVFKKYNDLLKIKLKNQYVIMFKHDFGIHKLVRESKECYVIHDKKVNRSHGYLKRKWYILKIWRGI